MQITEISLSDTELLLPLIEAYWRHDNIFGYERSRLRRQLTEFLSEPSYGCGWLATRTRPEVAVGYLLCSFVYSFEHGGPMAEVDELYVDTPYRRQRIGQALLGQARMDLAARGCHYLQMQVAEDNAPAQEFYAQQGFKKKTGYRLWLAPLP
ncbi:MAG TPA: GNAT family N-acetyltransferase [Steroidobacteraceae bacterium]|nr:GNAT family N-acetyltransferase [Steroidobacteraceae bacterium]